MRRVVVASVSLGALVGPARAEAAAWDFRTPGDGAYCRIESTRPALVFTCRSGRDGLACKHYDGLAFWLGRAGAYRIYYDKPGFRSHVRPLFRAHGVWRGIDLDVLEPAAPVLDAFAEGCSTRAGKAVFTCRNARVRLTCRNRGGHGFWVSRAAFSAF